MELETLKAELEKRDQELASANEALAAKSAEIDKLCEELRAIKVQMFNDAVAANFDLGALSADTAAWLLDMLRWSGGVEETCAKLSEIAGCIKKKKGSAPKEPAAEAGSEAPAAEAPTERATAVNIASATVAPGFTNSTPKWGIEHL